MLVAIDQSTMKAIDKEVNSYNSLDRAARRRVDRLVKSGYIPDVALKLEIEICTDCGARYCPCGMSEEPYVHKDHFECMHAMGPCSEKVAERIIKDNQEQADRVRKQATKERITREEKNYGRKKDTK